MTYASATAKKGFSIGFYTANAKTAMADARELFKKKFGTFATCLKAAWNKLRVLASGVVSFAKQGTGEVTTRNIQPVENYTGYRTMSTKHTGLMMAVDMDKVAQGYEPKACIISFYLNTVL